MEQQDLSPETNVVPPEQFEINREINDTDLLISRLRHPVIKRQVITALYNMRSEAQRQILEDEWVPFLPEGWDGTERFKLVKGKKTDLVLDVEELQEEFNKPLINKDEIEEWYEETVDRIETVTEIDYGVDSPNSEVMHLGWIQPWNEQTPTVKQWSAMEAHEKGHNVREYSGLNKVFQEGFDISKATFTDTDYQMLLLGSNRSDWHTSQIGPLGPVSLERMREIFFFDYLFTAVEIAERMSQLKNYFGFSGAEVLTKAHLDYARANYLKDTNLDNGMRLFFEAITPETEEKFLHIINNYGI